MHSLLFFEFIGTSELLVVLVVALIIFGPRKLPEMGRSLGKALNQFREASDSLKRTWEAETMVANNSAATLPTSAAVGHTSGEAPKTEYCDSTVEASADEARYTPPSETVTSDEAAHAVAEASLVEC